MPRSALPLHLQDIENNFPDDEQFGTKTLWGKFYRWFNKTTKTWFAFSYRCTERWARWRKYPKVLFAIGGKGYWRYEDQSGSFLKDDLIVGNEEYLSRIQYYKRWHIAIQWPLMISGHVYFKAEDMPTLTTSTHNLDGKLLYFYWNHFDADLVYWMVTSLFIGTTWK